MRITRVKQSAGRPTAVGGRNSRGQPWTAIMAVDGRDGCGRPRTTVAAVDGNEQLLTAVDGSDGCGRMPTAVDRRGRPSMAMMLADSPGLRWRDAQGRGQVQEWRRSGHGRVLHTSSVWCYHQHATHETLKLCFYWMLHRSLLRTEVLESAPWSPHGPATEVRSDGFASLLQ